MAPVQTHEVGKESEEGGAGICVVEECEEVEHWEGGQSQGREHTPSSRTGLQEKKKRARHCCENENTKYMRV